MTVPNATKRKHESEEFFPSKKPKIEMEMPLALIISDIFLHICSFLPRREVEKLSILSKEQYEILGNRPKWKRVCKHFSENPKRGETTYKTLFYQAIQNHCVSALIHAIKWQINPKGFRFSLEKIETLFSPLENHSEYQVQLQGRFLRGVLEKDRAKKIDLLFPVLEEVEDINTKLKGWIELNFPKYSFEEFEQKWLSLPEKIGQKYSNRYEALFQEKKIKKKHLYILEWEKALLQLEQSFSSSSEEKQEIEKHMQTVRSLPLSIYRQILFYLREMKLYFANHDYKRAWERGICAAKTFVLRNRNHLKVEFLRKLIDQEEEFLQAFTEANDIGIQTLCYYLADIVYKALPKNYQPTTLLNLLDRRIDHLRKESSSNPNLVQTRDSFIIRKIDIALRLLPLDQVPMDSYEEMLLDIPETNSQISSLASFLHAKIIYLDCDFTNEEAFTNFLNHYNYFFKAPVEDFVDEIQFMVIIMTLISPTYSLKDTPEVRDAWNNFTTEQIILVRALLAIRFKESYSEEQAETYLKDYLAFSNTPDGQEYLQKHPRVEYVISKKLEETS